MSHYFSLNEHGYDVCSCNVILDTSSCVATFPGEMPVAISDTEARILLELMRAKGAPVSKSRLIRKVWGGCASNDALAQRVCSLRRKVGQDHIMTVYGYGYRLNV